MYIIFKIIITCSFPCLLQFKMMVYAPYIMLLMQHAAGLFLSVTFYNYAFSKYISAGTVRIYTIAICNYRFNASILNIQFEPIISRIAIYMIHGNSTAEHHLALLNIDWIQLSKKIQFCNVLPKIITVPRLNVDIKLGISTQSCCWWTIIRLQIHVKSEYSFCLFNVPYKS